MKKPNRCIRVLCFTATLLATVNLQAQSYKGPDFNQDGKADLAFVWEENGGVSANVNLSTGTQFKESKWIHQSGMFSPTDRFFYGDFNGDGKSDMAQLGEENAEMICTIYLSGKSSFKPASWAAQSGTFLYSDKWFVADFNGDGKSDLARGYEADKVRLIDVYLSTGTAFSAPVNWAKTQNAFDAGDIWLTGDFNGDDQTDFAIIEKNDAVEINVYLSTGSSFAFATWGKPGSQGDRLTSMKWVAEDFDGDGISDIAKLWNDQNKVSIDVHRSTGDGFKKESWVTQVGDFVREHKWFIADFNGDNKVDIARLWNQNGQIHIESYQSDGSAFSPITLLSSGVTYRDINDYVVGDFDAHAGSDLAVIWADGSTWNSQIVSGGTSAESASSNVLGAYYSMHNMGHPVYGDQFLNPHQIKGAVPPGADLQAVLDAGNDLQLVKNGIYNVNQLLEYRASGQAIRTFDARLLSEFAIIRMQIDQGDRDMVLKCDGHDYVHLENITIDGNKFTLGERVRPPQKGQGAMAFFCNTRGVWIKRCVFYSTRTWSTCHLVESGDSHSHIAEHNYVLGAGVDPRGSGRNVGEIGKLPGASAYIGWADGFSVSASNTIVRSNFIMDTTDVGVVIFSAPGCRVADNMIVNYSRSTHGGINMVDSTRLIGEDSTFDDTYPLYDYRGIIIENNRLAAEGARIMIGIPFGDTIWGDSTPHIYDFNGGVIRNNTLEGGAFGFGFALDYIINLNFYGNSSTATHSGVGSGSKYNDYETDPAAPFFYDPDHITIAPGGKLQDGFTENVKKLEDLLYHHSKPYTEDGFLYYPITKEAAKATVQAAYWEMLGRQPTAEELREGIDSFLNNVYQYGDAFRQELMLLPEFVSKFGRVAPENLHPFRVARWRDRFAAFDMEEMTTTGNYPDPKAAYDAARAGLEYTLSEADAKILDISPALPTSMAQGQSVSVAVTVKNTGSSIWENRVADPINYALASVGDDTRFGNTRFYIPDGTSVAPGEKFVFHLNIVAPPVAWAGEGKPTTTSIPYDFRMMLESKGTFGESITDYLGATHQIEVDNAPQPPPEPMNASKFISMKILGDPQINGVKPDTDMVVEITYLNTGNETAIPWAGKAMTEKAFSLGSENPKDNRTWGSNRFPMEATQVVKPGELATFVGTMKSPSEPGTYNFQWQVMSATSGVGWFGELTPNLEITVADSAPALSGDYATAISSSAPETVQPGESFNATFEFKNEGTTTWTPEGNYKLGEVTAYTDRTTGGTCCSQFTDSPEGKSCRQLFDNLTETKYYTDHSSAWVQYRFGNATQHKITSYALTSVKFNGNGPELMLDGSFENNGTTWDGIEAPIVVTSEEAHTGLTCLKINEIPAGGDSKYAQKSVPTTIGKMYELSVWYKAPKLMSGKIIFDTADIYDGRPELCTVSIDGVRSKWTQFKGTFTATQTNLNVRIFTMGKYGLDGAVYIDDVSLTELGAANDDGDPKKWWLAGSNNGKHWTVIDSQSDIDFPQRGQKKKFDVSRPAPFEYYRLTATNNAGGNLQFAELELLTDDGIWVGNGRATLPTPVAPGESHTFTLNLTAPMELSEYDLQTRMLKEDDPEENWFGEFSSNHSIKIAR